MSEKINYSKNEEQFVSDLKDTIRKRGLRYSEAPLDTTDTDGCELTVYGPEQAVSAGSLETKREELGAYVIIARGEADPYPSVAEVVSNSGFESSLNNLAREVSSRVLRDNKPSEPGM